MGSMQSLMGMLPVDRPVRGLAEGRRQGGREADQPRRSHHQLDDLHERNHHEVINGSRRKRIARGSGTTVQEVNNLLRQYAQMKKMFKQMGKPSFARRLAGMKMPGM